MAQHSEPRFLMVSYSDDEFESDIEEAVVDVESFETALHDDDHAEIPRVSPTTKLRPIPRVYQPVYPASPLTIAGGVSPSVSPSPGKFSPGTSPNVFKDEKRNDLEPEARAREKTSEDARRKEDDAMKPEERDRANARAERSIERERSTDPGSSLNGISHATDSTQCVFSNAKTESNESTRENRIHTPTRLKSKSPTRMTNPVRVREEALARRRREAAANAPRTPSEARRVTRAAETKRKQETRSPPGVTRTSSPLSENRFEKPRDRRGGRPSSLEARVVRADLQSGAPIFSRRVAEALRASGAPDDFLVEETGAVSKSGKNESVDLGDGFFKGAHQKTGKQKLGLCCFVATAETGRGGTYLAARGSRTPYAPVPTHRTYAWYKQFGFAGKGALSSWGYNPKRKDIQAMYEKADAARSTPRKSKSDLTRNNVEWRMS